MDKINKRLVFLLIFMIVLNSALFLYYGFKVNAEEIEIIENPLEITETEIVDTEIVVQLQDLNSKIQNLNNYIMFSVWLVLVLFSGWLAWLLFKHFIYRWVRGIKFL